MTDNKRPYNNFLDFCGYMGIIDPKDPKIVELLNTDDPTVITRKEVIKMRQVLESVKRFLRKNHSFSPSFSLEMLNWKEINDLRCIVDPTASCYQEIIEIIKEKSDRFGVKKERLSFKRKIKRFKRKERSAGNVLTKIDSLPNQDINKPNFKA